MGLPAAILRDRERVEEIARVLTKYGFAAWVQHGNAFLGGRTPPRLVERHVKPEITAMSDGERLRHALTELGTTWIKLGQTLSMRRDWIGDEAAAELSKLHESAPADPPGVARALVERELGSSTSELFAGFDPEPIASGSVAQVHRAALRDGTPVAVKVLHDGVERRVLKDLELMRDLAKYLDSDREFAQFRPSRLVADFAQMMHDAIDLSQELNNLHRFIANFDAEKDVVFPTPYPELSSRRVLTMSFISGCALTERSSIEATGWEVDTVLHRAADIYLEMIFRDSFFHADPHPGNLRLPDGKHVAILDFGDVGHVSSLRRRQLEDLVIAMGTHDVDGLVDVIVDMTTPPPSVDMNQLRSAIEGWLDRSMVLGAGQIDMIGFIETGMTVLRENRLILPADLALLFRVVLGLEGLGREVDTEIRVNELMAEYVRPLLASRLDPRSLVRSFGRAAHAWEALIGSLPREIERVVHEMRAGQLGIDFRVRDTDGAVDHLIDGLIASASLLASAELMSRRSGPTVGSLSIPGVVAAGVGALTWRRLVRRRDLHQTLISRARKVAALGTARNFA